MSKNLIKYVVIILGILIFIAFVTLIYGIYLKLSVSRVNITDKTINFSNQLIDEEKIKNIEVINKNMLLIIIEENQEIKGIIYDIKANKINRIIAK
tara:strand:+ start:234 stop:521 length:288 start_codon:yes stop_codon:yes gene_type:complete